MPKKHPEPFWRTQTKSWYVQFGRDQVRLGRDEAEAYARYHELMAERARAGPDAAPAGRPVAEPIGPRTMLAVVLVDEFLSWVKLNRSKGTATIYSQYLVDFAKSLPEGLSADQVKPFHLTKALEAHPTWGVNTRGNYIRTVKNAFGWGAREGYIADSRVEKVKAPAYEPRETVVSPLEWGEIMDAVKLPQARDLLELAYETGSRPQEIRAIEARHVQGHQVVFPTRKSKGRKFSRTIYLGTDRAREIVARLAEAHPSGPILRNSEGRPWNKDSINCLFVRIQKKLGRKFHLGALRKSFATEALKNGVDPLTTAHLMGHRDATMVAKVYARVQQDAEHMGAAARRARTPKPKG